MTRDPSLAEWDQNPNFIVYRCSFCSRLCKGPLGLEGTRHEECATGYLTTIARVSRAMLLAHETAGLLADVESA